MPSCRGFQKVAHSKRKVKLSWSKSLRPQLLRGAEKKQYLLHILKFKVGIFPNSENVQKFVADDSLNNIATCI
ncbi:hypothetical protein DPMN_142929 [Dreissena polymorpha]|uniref:Uncharacterized protein n=1 Tax=Dreissena polymorpha TaxID=45954 RepID=A0A9D4JJ64_DREPO|nr:hypothetical protein DPMN_142929 [Dreissena polymorpha]